MKTTGLKRLTNERFLNLWEAEFEHNGKPGKWTFASRNNLPDPSKPPVVNAVIVFAIVKKPEGNFLLVTSEYRVPIGGREYGVVAGLKELNESAYTAAVREVHEETGLKVTKHIRTSPPIISSAGLSDECTVLVFVEAEGELSSEHLEENEDIEPMLLDYAGVCDLCNQRGKFEGVMIAAKAWPVLYMYEQIGKL